MSYTLLFSEIDAHDLAKVGGKGTNLGVLSRAGLPVPPGFCVTTDAFDRFLAEDVDFSALDALDGTSAEAAKHAAEATRASLSGREMPADVARAIVSAWHTLGSDYPLAVRSSATAEDLPGASFAGQQDSYLNIRGEAALLDAVRRCWISLFTDRAVLYRARGRFGHSGIRLSVVVQRLIDPDVSGILFTADPISNNRQIASIDAGFGLGEALVAGLIDADLYRIDRRTGKVLSVKVGDKAFAIRSTRDGGTAREELRPPQRAARALKDAQLRALTELGTRIEAIYGSAQDIEWCLKDGVIFIVQARPITSLYPIPVVDDETEHVFISFHHLQMMLDAMPLLARQVWQRFFPVTGALREAGSRLYIDATGVLRVPLARKFVLGALTHLYEALGASVAALVASPAFLETRGHAGAVLAGVLRHLGPIIVRVPVALLWGDPQRGAANFQRALDSIPQRSIDQIDSAGTLANRVRQCAVEAAQIFRRVRRHLPQMFAGVLANRALVRLFPGDPDVDTLMRGLPGNVTTEMDLAVGDLSDLLRPHPELATLIKDKPWPEARDTMMAMAGGPALVAGMDHFLSLYGNRGSGEIDISRPRWRDDPSLLLRVMSGGLTAASGAARRHHEEQTREGERAAQRLIDKAAALRRPLVRRLTRVARIGMGLREHPKFLIIGIFAAIRREALVAGELLAKRGQIDHVQQVFHLGFDELADALEDATKDCHAVLAERIAAFELDRARKPPLVMSSDGEIPILDRSSEGFPAGALPGTAASSGVVEGIARVVTDPDRETILAGEILVAPFTDPGWTPLFINAAGVVTEVGGVMTHGAVVAREYGIPAVVSVHSALAKIKTGQRIRVDGTRGFVQILEET